MQLRIQINNINTIIMTHNRPPASFSVQNSERETANQVTKAI